MERPGRREFSNLPEVVPFHQLPELAPSDGLVVVANAEEKIPASEHVSAKDQSPNDPPAAAIQPSKKQTVWGLSPHVFFALIAISAFLLVGAVVGIAVGVTVSQKHGTTTTQSPETPNQIPSATSNLLSSSNLASANFTDPAGYFHLYVFFQDESGELFTSTWDSQNTTWATLSISNSLSASGLSLSFVNGTPIAAFSYTNPSFQLRVYAMTPGGILREMLTTDYTLTSGWQQGSLGSTKILTAGQGSKIAALRPQCGTGLDCQENFPNLAVAYQDPQGNVNTATSPNYVPVQVAAAVNGTGIGLTSVMIGDNITDVAWQVYYDDASTLVEGNSDAEVASWQINQTLGSMPPPGPMNFAAFSFDLVSLMIVSVQANGTLSIRTLDTGTWAVDQSPVLVNIPQGVSFSSASNVTAIAGNPQKRTYAVIDQVIYEFEFSGEAPLQWSYIGLVPTSLSSS